MLLDPDVIEGQPGAGQENNAAQTHDHARHPPLTSQHSAYAGQTGRGPVGHALVEAEHAGLEPEEILGGEGGNEGGGTGKHNGQENQARTRKGRKVTVHGPGIAESQRPGQGAGHSKRRT